MKFLGRSSGMCYRITAWSVSNVQERLGIFLGPPLGYRLYVPSKLRGRVTQWHDVTCQKNGHLAKKFFFGGGDNILGKGT